MFKVRKAYDGTDVSPTDDPEYSNPVTILLDSTEADPLPSDPVELHVTLPAGVRSTNARVYFEGTTSSRWEVSRNDPEDIGGAEWLSEATNVTVSGTTPTSIWIRGLTFFPETPSDDRSVALRIQGETQRVE